MVASAVAAIALFLLALSGMAKLADPEPTTGAMRAAHLPSSGALTYVFGIVEMIAATIGLVFAGFSLAVATALYAAFSIFTLAAVRQRIPVQSCGCFGREDTPPSSVHVAFNMVATVALMVSMLSSQAPVDWTAPLPEIVLYVVFALVGAYASFLLLARLPQLFALLRSP